MADLVGRLHPPGRRAGHGPRRRLRAAPAPGAGADPGRGPGGQGRAPRWGRRPRRWWPSSRRPGHRVRLDDRTDTSFGRRSVAWELKGVPVRVEVGPRDLAEGNVTVVTRHRREKQSVAARRRRPARWPPSWPRPGPSSWPRPRRPATPGRWMPRHSRRPSRRASVGFARVRLGALGPDGEDRLAQHAALRPLPAAARRLAGRARRRRGRPRGRRRPVLLAPELL